MELTNRQESLYRTVHNTSHSYRDNNWGVVMLKHWVQMLPSPPLSILEVGCGNGKLCRLLKDMQYDVTGIDIVPGPYERKGYEFVIHNLQEGEMPFADKVFDYCVSFDVLEHIETEKINDVLWEMFRVAKNIILMVPCHHNTGKGLMKALHLTVKFPEWWIERINKYSSQANMCEVKLVPSFDANIVQRLLFHGKSAV